jgi:hypothetical protein
MALPNMTIDTFIKDYFYKKNDLAGFIQSCQIAGGFQLPTNPDFLKRLTVENIYDRVSKIGDTNLVFASEINDEPITDVSLVNMVNFNKRTLTDIDCGFFYKVSNLPQTTSVEIIQTKDIYESADKKIYLTTKGDKKGKPKTIDISIITIPLSESTNEVCLSIHLPGDGLIGAYFDSANDHKKIETIENFLTLSLPVLPAAPLLICGDTNLTSKKCNGLIRDKIGRQISQALKAIYKVDYLVIMSNIKVKKFRSGFLLINRQLKKSTYKAKTVDEEDGTIIALRLPSDKLDITKLESLPSHYSCYLNDKTEKNASSSESKDIYSFETDNDDCVDDYGAAKDIVFLDHSVLQCSTAFVNDVTGITIPGNIQNIVSLNLGSIANSGLKNWNTSNIKYASQIALADKALYEKVLPLIASSNSAPVYEEIVGSSEGPNGLDEIIITPTPELIEDMNEIIGELKLTINPVSAGGTRKRRNRSKKRKQSKRKKSKRKKSKRKKY